MKNLVYSDCRRNLVNWAIALENKVWVQSPQKHCMGEDSDHPYPKYKFRIVHYRERQSWSLGKLRTLGAGRSPLGMGWSLPTVP